MKQLKAIFKKEMLELYRDKIALLFLIIPIIAFPIVSFAMSYVGNDSVSEVKFSVLYETQSDKDRLYSLLSENTKYKFSQIDYVKEENQLNNGEVDFIVIMKGNNINLVYCPSSFKSISLAAEIGDYVDKNYNKNLSNEDEYKYNVSITDENGKVLSVEKSMSIIIIPIMLVMIIFQSTTSLANNSFAGEKERKTLEMLLLSGIKRKYILFGKSAALMLVSVINAIVCLSSCLLTYILNGDINQFKFMQSDNRFASILLIAVITLLLSALSVLISMTVSLITSNVKNAQLINEILLSVPVLVMTLVSFGIIRISSIAVNFIPVLNLTISFSDIFYGNMSPLTTLISIAETIAFIVLILVFDNYYINREKLLN